MENFLKKMYYERKQTNIECEEFEKEADSIWDELKEQLPKHHGNKVLKIIDNKDSIKNITAENAFTDGAKFTARLMIELLAP